MLPSVAVCCSVLQLDSHGMHSPLRSEQAFENFCWCMKTLEATRKHYQPDVYTREKEGVSVVLPVCESERRAPGETLHTLSHTHT